MAHHEESWDDVDPVLLQSSKLVPQSRLLHACICKVVENGSSLVHTTCASAQCSLVPH